MDRPAWPLGLSCERTTLAFWSEPLNALTTILCFAAAWACWRELRRAGGRDWSALFHIGLLLLLGATSFGMHTIPTRTLSLIDTVVTVCFILVALFGLFYRHLQLNVFLAGGAAAVFLAAAPFIVDHAKVVMSRDTALFIPVLFIFPLAGALMVFHAEKLPPKLRERQIACARLVMYASLIFMFGLAARALDQPFCSSVPTGVHFLWHIAFATTCGLVTIAYIRNRPAGA